MATIDPTTNLGKVRLRCADWNSDAGYFLPDAVYEQTLIDTNQNVPRSASICAQYILGILSQRTHKKLQQLELFNDAQFTQYLQFLKITILNPNNLSDVVPIPYAPNLTWEHPITAFIYDWNHTYARGTNSQQLAWMAYPSRQIDPTDPYAPNPWWANPEYSTGNSTE